MALLEKPKVDVNSPITSAEAREVARTGVWGDEAALKLVVQDAIRAENFESTKQWVMQWPTAATLYQSPYTSKYWEGTQVERANVPFFTVATAVNALAPQIMKGLFYDDPPFMIQNRPGTSSQSARAVGAIVNYELDEINFRESLRLGVINAVLFGTTIWKWGWDSYTKVRKLYKRKIEPTTLTNPLGSVQISNDEEDNIELVEEEEVVERPVFEHIVNLRHVLVDPGLNVPDIQKAKYVIHRSYLTWTQLEKLRDRPGMDLPSKDKLLELFFPPKEEPIAALSETSISNPAWDAKAEPRYEATTIDPLNDPLEVLERWDEQRYIMVLQQKAVIANDENPYGQIPFLSIGWWDVPESFYGMGIAKTIGSEQRLQQGVTNAWLDNVALNLNGVYTRVRGKSVPTQNIRIAPGKIVDVDNKDDFMPLKRLDAVPEAGAALQLSQQRAEQVSGASEASMSGAAGASGHSNLARTAAGANLLATGAGSRIEDFIDKLATQVIIPFYYAVHEMNCALLPMTMIQHILDKELQHEFIKDKQGDVLELLNARVKFSILAASKLQARRNMAQALPILVQYLQSEPVNNALAMEGKKVNTQEILRMFFEVSDWRNYNDVILPMTPEDQKRWQQQQPGAQVQAQAEAKSALMDKAHGQKAELIDQENISRAGREVMRQAIEQSAGTQAVTGEPGGKGFGANI